MEQKKHANWFLLLDTWENAFLTLVSSFLPQVLSTEVRESLVQGHGTPEGIVGAPAQLSSAPFWKRNAQYRVWENSESQRVMWRTAEGPWAEAAHWSPAFPSVAYKPVTKPSADAV